MTIEKYKQLYNLAVEALNDIDMNSPRFGKKDWNDICALKYAYVAAIDKIMEDAYFIVDDALQEGLKLPTIED